MGISDAKIEELTAKHGRVRYCEGDGDEWGVLLALPDTAVLKRYKHELHDPALRPDAQENLFKKMAVACWTTWTGECDVATLLKYVPMAPEGCSDAISALTGLKAQERVKR
jgi:hypothetical protein